MIIEQMSTIEEWAEKLPQREYNDLRASFPWMKSEEEVKDFVVRFLSDNPGHKDITLSGEKWDMLFDSWKKYGGKIMAKP